MFRVEVRHAADEVLIKLEGQLIGEFAEVARASLTHLEDVGHRVVDLTDVTSIDAAGEQLLLLLTSLGARFVADNTYSRYLCERLGLTTRLGTTSAQKRKTRS